MLQCIHLCNAASSLSSNLELELEQAGVDSAADILRGSATVAVGQKEEPSSS